MAKKTAMTGKVMQVAGIGAGAIASGYLTNFIPVENAKIKAKDYDIKSYIYKLLQL